MVMFELTTQYIHLLHNSPKLKSSQLQVIKQKQLHLCWVKVKLLFPHVHAKKAYGEMEV